MLQVCIEISIKTIIFTFTYHIMLINLPYELCCQFLGTVLEFETE